MKFDLSKFRRASFALMECIILCMFTSAVLNILYWQTNQHPMLGTAYNTTLVVMFVAELLLLIIFVREKRIDSIFIVALIWLIYEIAASILIGHSGILSLIRDGLVWPLLFLSTYLYVEKYGVERSWSAFTILFTTISILLLIRNLQIHRRGEGLYGGVIGPLYYCISFLGLILLFENKSKKYIFGIIILLFLLISTKRNGSIAVILGLLLYYLIDARMQNKLSRRVKRYLTFAFGLLIAGIVVMYLISINNFELYTRLVNVFDDQGSGRVYIWNRVILAYENSTTIEKIFGNGFHSVLYKAHPAGINRNIYAHNSYLETLYDFGVVGLTALIVLTISMIGLFISSFKTRRYYAPVLAYSLVCVILLSMFGYFFEESRFILGFSFQLGVILGINKRSRRNQRDVNFQKFGNNSFI